MVEPLLPSAGSSMDGRVPSVDAREDCPRASRVEGMRVVLVRHFDAPHTARAVFASAGVRWPERSLDLEMSGTLLAARRHPGEVIVIGDRDPRLQHLLDGLAPGQDPDAMAIDLTHGLGVIELRGPRLDEWLAHLVDSSGIPACGRASRCRFADVAVMLVRPEVDRICLVADRALAPYIANWLAFAHEGAFSES